MGLLDDAIREHLDLKRRRGADPTEIERSEREALGPVRRGPEPIGEGPEVADEDVAPESAAEPEAPPSQESEEWERFHEDPELALEEHADLPPYEHPRAPGGDALLEDEPFAEEPHAAAPPPAPDISPAPEAEPSPPPHPAEPAQAPEGAHPEELPPHLDQETEEYDVEAEEEADDDVLETTPEFLQDAPEHDRLWFEQRPPRDFDFDG
jgi:hypothetical protein